VTAKTARPIEVPTKFLVPARRGDAGSPADSLREGSLFRHLRQAVNERIDLAQLRARTSLALNEDARAGLTRAALTLCEWAHKGCRKELAKQRLLLAEAADKAAYGYRELAKAARRAVDTIQADFVFTLTNDVLPWPNLIALAEHPAEYRERLEKCYEARGDRWETIWAKACDLLERRADSLERFAGRQWWLWEMLLNPKRGAPRKRFDVFVAMVIDAAGSRKTPLTDSQATILVYLIIQMIKPLLAVAPQGRQVLPRAISLDRKGRGSQDSPRERNKIREYVVRVMKQITKRTLQTTRKQSVK
jgi:hypothetical protein